MDHRLRIDCPALALLVLTGIGFSSQLPATTLQRMSLVQMAQAADIVVRAQCLGASTKWENGAIWTFTDFKLLEPFKGHPPARIRVRLPGGRVGNTSMRVEEAPEFKPGEDVVLFLEAAADGSYGVTAWSEGTFRIRGTSISGQDLVTQDSSGTAVFDPLTRQFRQDGIRNLPISEFRQRLQNALMSRRGGSSGGSK